MKNQFVFKKPNVVFKDIIDKEYFKRYNLNNEWNLLKKQVKKFKVENNREPFIFDLIENSLQSLNKDLIHEVKGILYKKNYNWFKNVGQYYFYNFNCWARKLIYENTIKTDINDFLESWWSKFCEFENHKFDNYNESTKYPEKILLELTNNCNLNCIMCGVGEHGYDPSRNFPLKLLRNLSESVLSNVTLIRLNGLGESTILPNFLGYLELICRLPIKLEIVTNLTIQRKKIWDYLLKKNANFLISCDSADPLKYEQIRRGASFSAFKKNLKYIGKNIDNPLRAQIIFTLMKLNVDDLVDVIKLAAENGLGGVIVNIVKLDSNEDYWGENEYKKIRTLFHKSYNIAKELGIHIKLPDHLGNKSIDAKISNLSCNNYCENPWREVYIRYNGDLTVCNMLNPYIYGNCKNYPFEKIWNGLNSYMFRSFVNTDFRHFYCKDCYYLV